MTIERRRDSRRIRQFLGKLKRAEWLGSARRWWPDYLFHVTDVQNAVSILRLGKLLSRQEADSTGVMVTDNASPEIIERTEGQWKQYARLFFRPRAPTHFRSEGFRPIDQRELNAHMPVPICFIFDANAVLSRSDSRFSNGTLASTPEVFSAAADLERIPFEFVYHDGRVDDDMKRKIVFHRQAEVIVPRWLDLGSLRFIACRSQAEYETLLHLMPPRTKMRWENSVGVFPEWNLFHRRWTFVEMADLDHMSASFHFNAQSEAPGPFHAQVVFTDALNNRRFRWDSGAYTANVPLVLNLEKMGPLWEYSARLSLDDQIAYYGRYQRDESLPW